MNRVVGYVRVSTDEQAAEGVSLDAQRAKIKAWATLNDCMLHCIYSDEGISGKAMNNRPGLNDALAEAKKMPGTVFVIYSISRLTRSALDAIRIGQDLKAANVDFVSLTEQIDTTTAMGMAFYQIVAVLAELERTQTVERTKSALDHKRSQGEALGNVPFGFSNTNPRREHGNFAGRLVPNGAEMPTLRRMLELRKEGHGWSTIAVMLDNQKLAPRSTANGKWDRGSVRRIVAYYTTGNGQKLMKELADGEGSNLATETE